ncbi:M14 family zinc carboxypeptidase [Streptomyces sp. NPDC048603]|uniref:M14 family zinc carboxypeptidase n=1 Tax=Streptomyces sp. NPDC048603 TaxID=3365577 RepID=UPI0037189BF0
MDLYPTLTELTARARRLAEDHPGALRLREVGRSRGGRPLWLLSVGRRGRHDVLVVAGAHANEPVGGLTALRLAAAPHELERTGCTWHFLLCLDPDGMALNDGWIRRPASLEDYYRGLFRPASTAQPEFLPAGGERETLLPESRVLVDLLDELRPVAQFSLHGVDVGGAFVQLTEEVPGAAEDLARAASAFGIPVEHRPYDGIDWDVRHPGVLVLPDSEVVTERDPAGFSAQATWLYAMRHGTVSAVVEAPAWAACGVSGPGAAGTSPDAAIAAVSELLLTRADRLERALGGLRGRPGPFTEAARELLGACGGVVDTWKDLRAQGLPGLADTAGNCASLGIAARRIPLRAAAMMRRGMDPALPAEARAADTLAALVAEWSGELRAAYAPTWIPPTTQSAFQARTVLSLADRLLTAD